MKVGLLADIHGNAYALEAVLNTAAAEGVSRLLIAGDFVGYYHEPGRVMALLASWTWAGVRGNHEEMLQAWINHSNRDATRHRYGSGIETAAAELSADQVKQLLNLPHPLECVVEDRQVLICHGSPWDLDTYVYPDAKLEIRQQFVKSGSDLVVFGHTHYPVVWSEETTRVVNPGSVGQPRDRKPGACWALWDTDSHEVSLRRESYDATSVIAQASARDPNTPYLATVLTRTA